MTISSGFFDSSSGDRIYDADTFGRMFDGVIEDGIFAAIDDAFLVSEDSGMGIVVGAGRAWFNGTWTRNDAAVGLTVPTAHATLNRIDVVYLKIDKSAGVRANSVGISTGTPASTPVAPTLTDTSTVFYYRLALVYVGAAVTSIQQNNITNIIGQSETPFVSGPLGGVSVDSLLAQWSAEWTTWFDAIQGQLSTAAETNLQNQIYAIVGDVNPPVVDLLELDAHTHDPADFGGQITAAGIANRTRSWFVPVFAMGNWGSPVQINPGSNIGAGMSLSETDDSEQFTAVTAVPEGYVDGTAITVKVVWSCDSFVTQWRCRGEFHAADHGDWVGDPGVTSQVKTVTLSGAQKTVNISSIGTILDTWGGLYQGLIFFNLARDLAHADDTAPYATNIYGLIFEYTADS